MLDRVISGGQTGADQAGVITAKLYGIPTGGWMPKGWLTSTGPNPDFAAEYGLREHTGEYADRTATNVRTSDGTVRFAANFESLGEKCTLKNIRLYDKPYIDVDMNNPRAVEEVVAWINKHGIKTLNVAGNVEPKGKKAMAAGITEFTKGYLAKVFETLGYERVGVSDER